MCKHPLRILRLENNENKDMQKRSFAATALLLLSGSAAGQGLTALETEDLRLLYFDPAQNYLVPHVGRCFQNALAGNSRILDYDGDEKTTVFLRDYSDYGNAGASSVPGNTLMIDISPLSFTFESTTASERICALMAHEMVHVLTMDQGTKSDLASRRFFAGKVRPAAEHPETILYSYLTNPRLSTPRWFLEGIAVFLETWMAGGFGRAQGPYDEMVFRSMVRDGAEFYSPLGLESEGSKIDFQAGINNYLYGTRFMNYLAYTYSPAKLVEWATRKEGSRAHYVKDFENVFGLPLNDAWNDWIEFEHEFQNENLAAIRQFEITPYVDISSRGFGSVSRTFYDARANKLYSALFYPGVVAHVGEISVDDGSARQLVDVKEPMLYQVSSLAYDHDGRKIYYTTDHYARRDLMALDLDTGKTRQLLKDARIGELVFNKADRSIWGVRHLNGIATIVRMPFPYEGWNQVHSFEYGQVLYDMDISPDGQYLSTSMGELNGLQYLRIFELQALNPDETPVPVQQFDFGQAVPESFVFTPDGKYLYGSSYYTGISNIFRFEVATGDIEAVSNAESGFFRPVPMEDGSLIVFRYTGQGFLPTRIDPVPLEDLAPIRYFGTQVVQKYPELKEWNLGSPADIPFEDLIVRNEKYSALGNLAVDNFYPVVEGYKDEVALGFHTTIADPIKLDSFDFSFSHSINSELPSSEDLHASFAWKHYATRQTPLSGSWTFALRHNAADFYDLFGPTKTSRKGQAASITYEKTLIQDSPRSLGLMVDVSHYMNLEKLPRYQNIDVTFDELSTFAASLNYSNTRSSIGAVDAEKGFKWGLTAAASHVNGETIPKFYGDFDFGFALPIGNSSIWFRNAAGTADGREEDPFANYYFGGFGNNYVDSGAIKRYRMPYALPGFELNEIGGRSFYRSMFELNLPPLRFREVGGPRFYLSWARPSLFASALVANPDDSLLERTVYSYGAQIDLRFTVLSRWNMTLSFGYAVGDGDDVAGSPDEFMVSLKVL